MQLFSGGVEFVKKSDLDNKVNTDRSLYFLNDKHPLTESEIFNTDDDQGRLQAIHQRISENSSETFGGYDNILLFGGDDITSIFDVDTFNHRVKVSTGGAQGKANWSEFVAWKSDLTTKTIIQDVDINTLTDEGDFFVESGNLDHFPAGYRNQWYFLNVKGTIDHSASGRTKQTVVPDNTDQKSWTLTRTGTWQKDGSILWGSWLIFDFANGKLLKSK